MNETPWNDYGLIAYISTKVTDLGKTKLQKLVFLIKEVEHVPLEFNYRFYNYGPYSDGLAEALDIVSSLKGVSVSYDACKNMYEISPSANSDILINKAKPIIEANQTKIDSIIERFGHKTARDLELISTIIYVDRNLNPTVIDDMAKTTHGLKPKFSPSEIRDQINQLIQDNIVLQRNAQ